MENNQTPKRKKGFTPMKMVLIFISTTSLLLIGLVTLLVMHLFFDSTSRIPEQKLASMRQEGLISEDKTVATTRDGVASFTFTGVGDNLLHDTIFVYYEQDHNTRDYSPIYQFTNKYTQNTDLAYVNLETVCAGDEFGLSSYPLFNGPLEMLDTLARSGFDWMSLNSNHSLDAGEAGLQTEIQYLRTHHPEISTSGAYVNETQSNSPSVREVNGIRVGLASFTYGLNGFTLPSEEEWMIDVYRKEDGSINYELIQQRINALNEVSDVQIVSMHWGEEYSTHPTTEQTELAQYLSQLGVEVIIGSHPHVIQPVDWIRTSNQSTLVYYSLGNFISAQNMAETMIGGMAQFQINYNFNTKEVTFENVRFIPTVTCISSDLRTYRTTTLAEYSEGLEADHYITAAGEDLSKTWIEQYVQSILKNPKGVEIVI